jgi:hypothetical protein
MTAEAARASRQPSAFGLFPFEPGPGLPIRCGYLNARAASTA